MKKILAIALCVFLGSFVFAKSDLQILLGAEALRASVDTRTERIPDIRMMNIGIENYNLFDINSVFSLGFMESVTGSIGLTKSVDTDASGNDTINKDNVFGIKGIIGPAFGINCKDVAKLQFMGGFTFRYLKYQNETSNGNNPSTETSKSFTTIGFSTGVDAKFLPTKPVSPIIGFRYSLTGAAQDSTSSVLYDENFWLDSFIVNFGVSFNFGKGKAEKKQ